MFTKEPSVGAAFFIPSLEGLGVSIGALIVHRFTQLKFRLSAASPRPVLSSLVMLSMSKHCRRVSLSKHPSKRGCGLSASIRQPFSIIAYPVADPDRQHRDCSTTISVCCSLHYGNEGKTSISNYPIALALFVFF